MGTFQAMEEEAVARPVIGMSTGRMAVDYGPVPQYPLTYVPVDYVDAVLEAGGLPMPLALHDVGLYEGAVAEQLAHCDGLLLSGGVDINPATYGEQPHPELNATTPGTRQPRAGTACGGQAARHPDPGDLPRHPARQRRVRRHPLPGHPRPGA
jgi:hypothetical protein